MLREKAKTNRAPFLMRVAAIQVSTIGVNRFLKVIIDRYVFMYAQVVLRYPIGNLCWRLDDAYSRI